MIQFFAPGIEGELALPESDSRHAIKVLRLSCGDEIQVVDGRGGVFLCQLIDANPRRAGLEILEHHTYPNPWPGEISIIVSPTKHMDRMEWLVEKLTEVGVNRIIPLKTARSERKEIKTERLEKIAVSAMKQSLKAWVPEISPMLSLKVVATMFTQDQRVVGYCSEQVPRCDFSHIFHPGHDTAIMIGPEGDFTPEEIAMLMQQGWLPVTFGPTRLRTETAALYGAVACHVLDAAES